MDEPVRWVSKAEVARELEVSLSTLDRMIRRGEIEVVKEGRRVYVRTHGPEYLSDDELLRQAIIREWMSLRRTVRELGRRSHLSWSEERDEARARRLRQQRRIRGIDGGVSQRAGRAREDEGMASRLGVAVAGLAVLLVISVLVTWLLLT